MKTTMTRRSFLGAGMLAGAACVLPARAASAEILRVTTRAIDVRGRAATVFGIENGRGGQGLVVEAGQRFAARLTNGLDEATLVHWHGQIPPNAQDGVPDLPRPALAPGESRDYDFAAMPGTYWMHSHIPLQEMAMLAAPLIVRRAEDAAADRQEVVMFLHDFSFASAAELLGRLGAGGGHNGHGAAAADEDQAMTGMDHSAMGSAAKLDGSAGQAMDLNDIEFDAYLANDRTLDDPEVVPVEKGGRVLLRVINAASATVFWIDLGAVQGRLVAVDGHAVAPVTGSRFGLAMAQRIDIELDMPAGGAALPVLALREGARQRTGIVLAPAGAAVVRIANEGEAETPAFDLTLEARLQAVTPLAVRRADREHKLMLGGTMQPYLWTIDGQTWGNHRPIEARSGERVELTLHNMSAMAHPMHLHGHVFQVVAIDGNRLAGALRDTVHLPPMASVTIAFDAGEAARWMLHCHHMAHLQTGMMTELALRA